MSRPFFPVITLRGDARERGRQYGAQAGELIGLALETYLEAYRRDADLSREQVLAAARQFIPPIEQFDPELLTELKGVAEGSDRPLEEIVALNARNELLFAVQPECTAVAVLPEASGSGHTLLAQNLDWKTSATPCAVVLEIIQEDDRRPNIVTATEAGTLCRSGLNSAGLGLVVNFMNSAGSDTRRLASVGVPTQLLRRSILNCWTFGDAAGALYRVSRCIASNYLLAWGEGGALDLETAPEGIAWVPATEGLVTHANHFESEWGRAIDTGIAVYPDTIWRGQRIRQLLRPHVGRIEVDHVKAALRDHANYPDSICRHADERDPVSAQMESSVSIVMDLTARKLWVSAGPPCEGDYVELEFESLGRQPGRPMPPSAAQET